MRRLNPIDLLWVAFAAANLAAMALWASWETIPFHFIWVSLTVLYGFRVWRPVPTALVAATVNGKAPALEGVPDRTPDVALRVSPGGRLPEWEKVGAGIPLAANV